MRRHQSGDERGFALVAVIWGLGLVALLGMTLMVNAKYRSRISSDESSVVKATLATESAINLAIAVLLTPNQKINFPLMCRMPSGEQVIVAVEEEAGKVDLNTASKATLERLFGTLASDKALGSRIAEEIMKVRTFSQAQTSKNQIEPMQDKDGKGPARKPAFTSIMELDQVAGVTSGLFHKAVPFVTTTSGRNEPAPEAASLGLVRILGLAPPGGEPHRISATGNLTLRADVALADGSRQVREALIGFDGGTTQPYTVREWRLGKATEAQQTSKRLMPCVTI